MPSVGFAIASIALTAVSTYIQVQSAKKKEKRLQKLNDERAALQKKQNALAIAESKRTLNAATRKQIADRNSRLAGTGQNAESSSQQAGNQSILSRTEGAIDYTEKAGAIDDNLIDNSGAINTAQNSTAGLGTQLLASAASMGSSLAASKISSTGSASAASKT